MNKYLIILLVLITTAAFAQKKPKRVLLESKAEITEWAVKELDLGMTGPSGLILLFAEENGIKGTYIMDLTVADKGEIVTVFVVESKNSTIPQQNLFKDYLKDEFEFITFKVQKGKKYKVRYTFKFE
jgi:hypothetical protein